MRTAIFRFKTIINKNWQLYILISPALVYFIIFHYIPMYGVQIAFKNYFVTKGIWGSPWIGFIHLERFFNGYYFWLIISNTILINLYQLIVAFPVPIILALMINEVRSNSFKRFIQTITYAPYFLSTVVVVGMLFIFLNPDRGIINHLVEAAGFEPISFMLEAPWFKSIYVWSGVWEQMGWNSIIYLAALAGIDPQLHESAKVDGATRVQRIWHINIPGILPTVIILFIFTSGQMMSVGFEKIYLMQNLVNNRTSEVIATYVYKTGLLEGRFSFSAAVGLFNSVINMILLISVNKISRKVSETSLW